MFFRKFAAPALDPVQQLVNTHSKSSDMVNHDVMSVLSSELFLGDVEQGQATAVAYAQQRLHSLILLAVGDFSPLKESLFAQRAKLFETPTAATELSITALRIITGRSLFERQRSVVVSLGAVWGNRVATGQVRPVRQALCPVDVLVGEHLAVVRGVAAGLVQSVSALAATPDSSAKQGHEVAGAQHAVLVLESVAAAIGATSPIISQVCVGEDGTLGQHNPDETAAHREAVEAILGAFLSAASIVDGTKGASQHSLCSSVLDEIATSFTALVASHPFVAAVAVNLVLPPRGSLGRYIKQFCNLLVACLSQDVFSVAPSASVGGNALDAVLRVLSKSSEAAATFIESTIWWDGAAPKADLLDVICSDRVPCWAVHVAEFVTRDSQRASSSVVSLLHTDPAALPTSAVRRTNDRSSTIFLTRLLCSLIVDALTGDETRGQIPVLCTALCSLAEPLLHHVSLLLDPDTMKTLKVNSITVNNLCAMLRDFDVLFDTVVEALGPSSQAHGDQQQRQGAVPAELKRLATRWYPVHVQQTLRLPERCAQWDESGRASQAVGGFGVVLASVVKAAEDRHASLQDSKLLGNSFGQLSLFDAENQLLLLEGQKGSPTPDPMSGLGHGVSPQSSKELRRSGRVHRQHSFDITDVWKLDVDEVKDVAHQPVRPSHARGSSTDIISELLGIQPTAAASAPPVIDLFSVAPEPAKVQAAPPINLFEFVPNGQQAPETKAPAQLDLFESFGPPASSAALPTPSPAPTYPQQLQQQSAAAFDDLFSSIAVPPKPEDGPARQAQVSGIVRPAQPLAQQSLSLFDLFPATSAQ